MNNQHYIFVCTSCAAVWKDGQQQGTSGGEYLLETLTKLKENWELKEQFCIQETECLSVCDRPCAIAFAATDKYTYVFGDLPATPENLKETAATILQCAGQYHAKSTGILPWGSRPDLFKKGTIAKVPPLPPQ